MNWLWILVLVCAAVGPFEAMHALNKARKRREEAEKRKRQQEQEDQHEVPL